MQTRSDKHPATRSAFIDVLNITAIISCLILHHNGNVHSFSQSSSWVSSLIIETVFYFAVPVFIMITGATLLGYRQKYDTKTYFKKRFAKVLIPSIAWMIIMFCWHVFIRKDLTITGWSPASILNIFTASRENSVYYYLFVILGLYLTIPLFAPLTEKKYRKLLWYGVVAFFIFNALLPNLSALVGINYNSDFSVRIGSYVVYLFLGYLLSTATIPKKFRILLYLGGVLAIIWRYTTTLNASFAHGYLVKTTWGYTQFHTIILASAVYVFIKTLPVDKISDKTKTILAKLASCSFGIYLCHILVMHYEAGVLRRIGLPTASWAWRFFCPLLTYTLCVGLVLLLKKIPILRRIVP